MDIDTSTRSFVSRAGEGVHQRWRLLLGVVLTLIVIVVVFMRRAGVPEAAPAAAGSSASRTAASGASVTDSVVTLDLAAQQMAGIEVAAAAAASRTELVANGTIVYDADRVATVAPRTEGRIVSVRADLGQQVSAGQVLAIVESPDVGRVRGDLERARAAVSVARRHYEREQRLFQQEISPQKEMLDAEVAFRTAVADYNSALATLRSYGATTGTGGSYGLRSAVGGTVVERNASPGSIVGPNTSVFTVADLQHLWITVDIYEADLTRVQRGAAVTLAPTALPGETFQGRVSFAGGVVDSASRTIKVRVTVENESRRLRPGMFAQVRIVAPYAAGGPALAAVPEIAVQEVNGRPIVFVQASPGRFVARPVTVSGSAGDEALLITSGLQPGEQVVTRGAFQMKAELLKATFASGE